MGRPKSDARCALDECDEPTHGKGLCRRHYLAAYHAATKERDRPKRAAHYQKTRPIALERAKRNGAADRASNPTKYHERERAYRLSHREQRNANEKRRNERRRAAETMAVTAADWISLVRRYGNRCAYCGADEPLTTDHVIPISRGGRHAIGNLLPACLHCNASKGTKFLVEWRAFRRNYTSQGGASSVHL